MNVRIITRTAVLLALTIVFQLLGRIFTPYLGPNSNFIVGPLVNTCLIIATASAGLSGAALIAILAPFTALLTGAALPLPFLPFISIGNFILVLLFHIFRQKQIVGLLTGSILKFGFLFVSVIFFLKVFQVPPKLAGVMYFSFSWPQLVTALAGSIIALAVIRTLKIASPETK